jgi:hypothetical protein
VGQQGSASGSLLLDLDGFEAVSAELVGGEWQLAVQTTATMVGCAGCGVALPCTADAWCGYVTCRSVAARSCCCGASGSGAVVSQPAWYRPGPSGWLGSLRGRC